MGVAEVSMALPGIRKKSLMTIIATGDAATSMEPISIGYISIQKKTKLMETKTANKVDDRFLKDVSGILQNIPAQAYATPLYLALRRGIEVLRGQGCGTPQDGKGAGYLFAITDGEETEERVIRKALYSNGKVEIPEEMIIINDEIKVVFCGIASTNQLTPARNRIRADRLETVWKAVFSNPEKVSFQPFCLKREVPDDAL
jgi:hypothetical protein